MNDSDWYFAFVVGFIILASVSYGRFRGPSWVRSYTTAGRYYLGLTLYLLSQALLLYVLSASFIIGVNSLIEMAGASIDPSALKILTPIGLAILLAWIFPYLPVIRHFVLWQREACRRIAGAPVEAYELSTRLFKASFVPSDDLEDTVRSVLTRRGWEPNQSWLPVGQPVQELWFKTSLFYQIIRQWESETKYARFLDEARPEFDVLRKRYDQLSMKVVRTFQTIEGFGTILAELTRSSSAQTSTVESQAADPSRRMASESKLRTSITDILSDIRLDIDFLCENICLLIARGVLTNERTARSRNRRLRSMGFSLEKKPTAPGWILLSAFAIVIFVMFLTFAVLGTGSSGGDMVTVASMIVMIATMQIVALAVAIIPKRKSGFANIDINGRTPVGFILLAGVTTFGLALLVSLVFKIFIYLNLDMAIDDMVAKMPWLVMPCVTAMTTAFLIQDNRWNSIRSTHRRRLMDAVFMGCTLAGGIVIVIWLFGWLQDTYEVEYNRIPVGVAMGLIIGYLVPHAVRDPTYLDDHQIEQLKEKLRRGQPSHGAVAAT